MSILSMSRRAEKQDRIEPSPATPYAPRPKPVPPGPHQLGEVTLQALDEITEKCAAEYDKAADQLEQAAHERAEGLRDCAHRMRSIGFLASEKVSNFVKVMVTCADISLATQGAVARCDEPQPEPQPKPEPAAPKPAPVDLDAVAAQVADATTEPAPAAPQA
jgi:hypothetical protein